MASNQELLAVFNELLIEMGQVTEADEIGPDTVVSDLGLDSLSTLEFLMLVDERTGVEVSTEELTTDTTLDQLADLINRQSA